MTSSSNPEADAVSITDQSPPSHIIIKEGRSDLTSRTSLLSDDASDNSSSSWEPTHLLATDDDAYISASKEQGKDAPVSPSGPWQTIYEPEPLVDQTTVLAWGFFLFGLAVLWPPLVLLFAYVASKLIPYSFRTNDDPVTRRKLFAQFAQHENIHRHISPDIQYEDSFFVNQRGMLLHTITMLPKHGPIRAVVFYCHGYTDNVSFEKLLYKQRLVKQGIAFCAIEYEGHGLSDGAMGLINDFNLLVGDVTDYARLVKEQYAADKPMFLMGESMGGAVAYSVQQRIPDLIRGVVFVCPMCKISDSMLPPQPVIDILRWLIGKAGPTASWLGYLPIAPAREQMVTHKDAAKLLLACRVPLIFGRNPRLATARELIDVTQHISTHLKEFDAPFLVVHGSGDTVTDPKLSQTLYEESKSADKSIKLYDGMWHALMCGEPDENSARVFKDCINWILDRVDD